MQIIINGLIRDVPRNQNIPALLQALGLSMAATVVERNGSIIPRDLYADTVLEEGDRLELVRLVGGG